MWVVVRGGDGFSRGEIFVGLKKKYIVLSIFFILHFIHTSILARFGVPAPPPSSA